MTWNTNKPLNTDLIMFGDDIIRELKSDFKTIFSREHIFPDENAEVSPGVYGHHKEGSGLVYIGTSFPTPLEFNLRPRQLFWNLDTKKLYIYNDGWQQIFNLIPYHFLVQDTKIVSDPSQGVYEFQYTTYHHYYLDFIWWGSYRGYQHTLENPLEIHVYQVHFTGGTTLMYVLPTDAQFFTYFYLNFSAQYADGYNKLRFCINYTSPLVVASTLMIRAVANFEGGSQY